MMPEEGSPAPPEEPPGEPITEPKPLAGQNAPLTLTTRRDTLTTSGQGSGEPSIDLDIDFQVPAAQLPIPAHNLERRFAETAAWVAKTFHIRQLCVSICIVDDATIQSANRTYLAHDWPTDVISFQIDADDGWIDGELIASVETATRCAPQAGLQPADELLLYVLHGLLHIVGLDDHQVDDQARMRHYEQAGLMELGVPNAEQHLRRWGEIDG